MIKTMAGNMYREAAMINIMLHSSIVFCRRRKRKQKEKQIFEFEAFK